MRANFLNKEFQLKLHSEPENISLLEPFVRRVCDTYRLSDEYYHEIMLVLTEAVNNSIHHGNRCCPEKEVLVKTAVVKENLLSFTIQDEGKGFDPSTLPDPTAPENIGEPNGRGVYLMRQFAHDIVVRQQRETPGCQVVVHFRL